jgi:hypothetical protein
MKTTVLIMLTITIMTMIDANVLDSDSNLVESE